VFKKRFSAIAAFPLSIPPPASNHSLIHPVTTTRYHQITHLAFLPYHQLAPSHRINDKEVIKGCPWQQ